MQKLSALLLTMTIRKTTIKKDDQWIEDEGRVVQSIEKSEPLTDGRGRCPSCVNGANNKNPRPFVRSEAPSPESHRSTSSVKVQKETKF
jgi:hypothetical protein